MREGGLDARFEHYNLDHPATPCSSTCVAGSCRPALLGAGQGQASRHSFLRHGECGDYEGLLAHDSHRKSFKNRRRLRDATEVDASQTPALADSPSPVSGDISALVSVRGLLEEAVRRTADVSVIGRRVAAVLLDGAAEAAIATALAAFNDSPRERDSYDELCRRLVAHLHDAGRLQPGKKLDGWPDVRRLRLVRNGVQHHQIPPDHETLVGWTASVQRFVAHVIDAAYGLDVLAITAADAIGDEVIRSQFGEAERLIAAGEVAAGVKALSGAFSNARRRWQEQHRRAMGLQPGVTAMSSASGK